MAMTLYIDGKLINTAPGTCIYTDYAGGQSDSIELSVDDSELELRKLQLTKGMELQALCSNADTGTMYISNITYSGNTVELRALSLPTRCYATKNYYWEQIGFAEFVKDIADEAGLTLKLLDSLAVTYVDITRLELAPVQLLQARLELEGFACKIHNNILIVYDERKREQAEYTEMYFADDFSEKPIYYTKDAGLIARVENTCRMSTGKVIKTAVESGLQGRTLRHNISVSSIDESERFSRGIMRSANKYEFCGRLALNEIKHSAGEVIYIKDAPYKHDGDNYIYRVENDFAKGRQTLYVRKGIAGGY